MIRTLLALWVLLVPLQAFALTSVVVTGDTATFDASQADKLVLRSNGGAVMLDTLPGTSPGVLANGTLIDIFNDDALALLEVRSGSGATLDGMASNFLLLGPKQSARLWSDGLGYRTLQKPYKVKAGMSQHFYIDPLNGIDTNSGIDPSRPVKKPQAAYDYVNHHFDLNSRGATFKLADGVYTDQLIASFTLTGWNTTGIPLVVLSGNLANPGAVIMRPPTGVHAILASSSTYLYVEGIRFEGAINAVFWSFVTIWDSVQFGPIANGTAHMIVDSLSYINAPKAYELVGGGTLLAHIWASDKGHVLVNASDIYVRESFTFNAGFSHVNTFGHLAWYATIHFDEGATITGAKTFVYTNGLVQGGNKMPGSGQYVAEQGQLLP